MLSGRGLLVRAAAMSAGSVLAAAPAPMAGLEPLGRWATRPADPCKRKPGGTRGRCDKAGNWIVETPERTLLHARDGRRYLVLPTLPATGP